MKEKLFTLPEVNMKMIVLIEKRNGIELERDRWEGCRESEREREKEKINQGAE